MDDIIKAILALPELVLSTDSLNAFLELANSLDKISAEHFEDPATINYITAYTQTAKTISAWFNEKITDEKFSADDLLPFIITSLPDDYALLTQIHTKLAFANQLDCKSRTAYEIVTFVAATKYKIEETERIEKIKQLTKLFLDHVALLIQLIPKVNDTEKSALNQKKLICEDILSTLQRTTQDTETILDEFHEKMHLAYDTLKIQDTVLSKISHFFNSASAMMIPTYFHSPNVNPHQLEKQFSESLGLFAKKNHTPTEKVTKINLNPLRSSHS
jgi:hypothetical protein